MPWLWTILLLMEFGLNIMNKLILVGNPNTGKTTFFNSMTNKDEKTGNWHGVTVGVKSAEFKYQNQKYTLFDLPGLYSLDALSLEEKVSRDYIYDNLDSLFLCIVDANNLRRNLYLCYELLEITNNVILVVNMAKEVQMDYFLLEKELKIKVVPVDARKKSSIRLVKKAIAEHKMSINQKEAKFERRKEECFNIDKFKQSAEKRFNEIDLLLKRVKYNFNRTYGYSRFDKIVLSPLFAWLFFMLVVGTIFFITFGPVGQFLSNLLSKGLEVLNEKIIMLFSQVIGNPVAIKFIEQGVLGGAINVISFIPQVVLMLFLINLLEEIGYFSRVALMLDAPLKKIGLSGKSAFSLLLGFGCTTTAMITTKNLENNRQQKRTVFLLPFMSCSAKLPIFMVLCLAFFDGNVGMIVAMYAFAISIMILTSIFISRFNKTKQTGFILELPKYRMPNLSKIFRIVSRNTISFIIRVGGVLLLSSMLMFVLYNFDFSFKYVGESGNNILSRIAQLISFIFKPLGFNEYVSVALISGLIAKEMLVSTMSIINGVDSSNLATSLILATSVIHFDISTALTFMVFVLLYPPCLSAIFTMRKEVGRKVVVRSFIFQSIIAYVSALLTKLISTLFIKGLWIVGVIAIILLAISIFIMLKYIKPKYKISLEQNKCKRCNGCKEKEYGNAKL